MTAATRSPRFLCHRQRSVRSPHRPASVTRGAEERAGKSAKRRQWRMQRGDFEEVPRLAAATVAGNRLARRWAREPPPLRKRYKGCRGERNPPVTASPRQPPLGKGAKGTGDADCHSQFANWLRNDRVFARGAGVIRRADRVVRPYGGLQEGEVRRADVGVRPYGIILVLFT